MAKDRRNWKQEDLFIFLLSEHQYHHEVAFRRVEIDVRYSQQDWEALVRDAEKLARLIHPYRGIERRV